MSLLEVLVALTIMAIALGMIYRVSSGNVRDLGGLQLQQRAAMLAESLLDSVDGFDPPGLQMSGADNGFAWEVRSQPYLTPTSADPRVPQLHEVFVTVRWQDRGGMKELHVPTLRPQLVPAAGGLKAP